MEKQSQTHCIISDNDDARRKECLDMLSKPLATQRFMHAHGMAPSPYSCTLIVEKEDRISVVQKQYQLKFGTNGFFLKSNQAKFGATYHKKGRSSQRLRIWGNENHKTQQELVKLLADRVNPETKFLLDDRVIQSIATQGLISSIVAGAITDRTSAMEYYIRYSLRGTGIKVDNGPGLYSYLSKTNNNYTAISALRCAADPNSVLKEFQFVLDPKPAENAVKVINTQGQRLVKMALATGEKIDWMAPEFDVVAVAKHLSNKEKGIKDFLQLWEGGPVLKSVNRSVNPLDLVHVDADDKLGL